jgi:hypothetical protein
MTGLDGLELPVDARGAGVFSFQNMREFLRGSIGVVLVAAFLAAIVPVCSCMPATPGGEHACCAPSLALSAADGDCCPPSLTLETVAGTSFAAAAPVFAPPLALAPRGVHALAVAVAFAPSPPAILRI